MCSKDDAVYASKSLSSACNQDQFKKEEEEEKPSHKACTYDSFTISDYFCELLLGVPNAGVTAFNLITPIDGGIC